MTDIRGVRYEFLEEDVSCLFKTRTTVRRTEVLPDS